MLWHVWSAFCPATNASLSSSLYDQPPHLLTSWEWCLVYFQKDLKLGHTFSFCIFMLPHILFPHPYLLWIIPDLSRLISGIILSIMFTWHHLPFRPLWRNATHFILSTFQVFKNSNGRNLSHCVEMWLHSRPSTLDSEFLQESGSPHPSLHAKI